MSHLSYQTTTALGRGITHDQASQMQVNEVLTISAKLTDELIGMIHFGCMVLDRRLAH